MAVLMELRIKVLLVDPYRESIEQLTVLNDATVIRRMIDANCKHITKIPLLSEDSVLVDASSIHVNMVEKVRAKYIRIDGGQILYGRVVIAGWDDTFGVAKSTSISLMRARNSIEFLSQPLTGYDQ